MLEFSPESISVVAKVTKASVTRAGTGIKVTIVGVITGQLSLTSVTVTCEKFPEINNSNTLLFPQNNTFFFCLKSTLQIK